jgi:hypothetical protein
MKLYFLRFKLTEIVIGCVILNYNEKNKRTNEQTNTYELQSWIWMVFGQSWQILSLQDCADRLLHNILLLDPVLLNNNFFEICFRGSFEQLIELNITSKSDTQKFTILCVEYFFSQEINTTSNNVTLSQSRRRKWDQNVLYLSNIENEERWNGELNVL